MSQFFYLMMRGPPSSTRPYTLFPYPTLFRSGLAVGLAIDRGDAVLDPFQVGKRGALDPETVQHDPLRQNAVEVIEDGDQALGTRDFATAQDRKSTRLNSSHSCASRMPSSA